MKEPLKLTLTDGDGKVLFQGTDREFSKAVREIKSGKRKPLLDLTKKECPK